jgi:hypothetical protein
MTDEEVIEKFKRLAAGVVSDATAQRIADMTMSLDEMEDVTPLLSFETG